MKRSKLARIAVGAGVLVLAVAAAHMEGGAAIGTFCALCPVGFAQIAVAAKSVPWGLVPGVVALLAVVFVLGRAFCSWLCPSQLLKNVFGGRAPRGVLGRAGEASAKGCSACGSSGLKTQGIVLAVLLAVSFAVGFPVFCLLCPIGLVFGTLWALNRVFVLLQPGWELVVFPLMLIAELFLFKRWCAAVCPLGFFFGAVGALRARLGFGVRPRASCSTCRSQEGCRACATACPENLDVSALSDSRAVLRSCTLCLDCVEACPSKSISLGTGGKAGDARRAAADTGTDKGASDGSEPEAAA
ncbi:MULTISPECIES: 4Fe-4S binding protein [Eggerthellaceae]|uniref:4Fe-4S binding protein n=1 Tax=Eggerthellaceae TaxID=1643826 RepID=UPI000B3AFBB4|nr:4Fe-4S dicluster domain-containing protein [Gordonibacter sp. An230]OUO92552.1 4Fe-4S ferredoxin [Gordonibacter sp. An230]